MNPAKIYIGTSGWMYKSWAETFYPKDCAAKRHLEYYATRFPTVEINATFYRLPEKSTFAGWYQKAPEGFLYAVKGSRAVTHLKRLKPGARSFKLLLDRSRQLRDHLGPYLWQLLDSVVVGDHGGISGAGVQIGTGISGYHEKFSAR